MCEVNLPTTFRESLWVPSLLVMRQSVSEQRSGMLPYIGVEGVWASHSVAHLRSASLPVKMVPTVAPETSSTNSPRTPCKVPKTKKSIFIPR